LGGAVGGNERLRFTQMGSRHGGEQVVLGSSLLGFAWCRLCLLATSRS
jgi:hypothetical protein